MNSGFENLEEKPEQPTAIPVKDNKKKHLYLGIMVVLAAFGIIMMLGKKGKKDKETKRVRTITRTKTITKNKKDDNEEINEETDDNETDDNGTDDNGNNSSTNE